MYRTILVPLDGSAFSERALPVAASLAQALQAQVILVRAVSASVFPGVDATDAQVQAVNEAHDYLSALAAGLSEQNLNVDIATPYGDPAEMITLEVGLRKADLVVMCTHGRSGLGRWVYGSVAEQVLARSPVPVLLVRPTGAVTPLALEPGKIKLLVPLDGSLFAEAALPHAADLARALDGTILLMRMVEPPVAPYVSGEVLVPGVMPELTAQAESYLAEVAQGLREAGLSVETITREGWPADVIAYGAEALGVNLIVMTTRGRTGIVRLLLGSVAMEVVRRSPLPVMLIRPAEQVAM